MLLPFQLRKVLEEFLCCWSSKQFCNLFTFIHTNICHEMCMIAVEPHNAKRYFSFISCIKKKCPYAFSVNLIIKDVVVVFYFKLAMHPCFSDCRAVPNWIFFSHA